MANARIENFHAHIYFDPDQVDQANSLGEAARARFGVPVAIIIRSLLGRTRVDRANLPFRRSGSGISRSG